MRVNLRRVGGSMDEEKKERKKGGSNRMGKGWGRDGDLQLIDVFKI